jgi:putative oxidoreductase
MMRLGMRLQRGLPARWALLPVRVVVGLGFLAHGLAKWSRGPAKFAALLHQLGIPSPITAAWMTTAVEVLGGTALLIGLWVAVACIPLVATMLVAMFTIHVHYGFSAVNTVGLTSAGPQFGPPGYEINLLYIAILVALAVSRPTALSIDAVRHEERS